MTVRAAVYARVSTEDQAREGTSLTTQEERCRAFAAAKQWDLSGVYVDDGISGTLESRPALDRLLRDCRSGDVDAVVILKLDRLGRRTELLLRIARQLEEAGVVLAFVADSIDTSTASGRFFRTMLAGVAELERETILERTRAGLRKTAEAGFFPGGAPPFGFRVEDHRLVIDDEEAVTLRLATSLIIEQGCTTGEAAARLNALGHLPRRATRWEHINLRRTLRPRTLIGEWTYAKPGRYGSGDAPITVSIPAILAADQFAALQAALDAVSTRPTKTDVPYVLSGRLFGVCGAPFHGVYRSDRGTREYRCRNRRSEALSQCRDRRIPGDDLEEVVWWEVVGLLSQPERLMAMASDYLGLRASEVEVERDQRGDLERKIANLESALSERVAAALKAGVPPDALKAATDQLQGELDGLRRHRAQMDAWGRRGAERSQQMRRLWELAEVAHTRLGQMTGQEKARVLDLLDVRVTVLRHRSPGNPPTIRIEGTVYDRLVNALVDAPESAEAAGYLQTGAPRRPGPRPR